VVTREFGAMRGGKPCRCGPYAIQHVRTVGPCRGLLSSWGARSGTRGSPLSLKAPRGILRANAGAQALPKAGAT